MTNPYPLRPLDPVAFDIKADSPIIRSGGLSNTMLHVYLRTVRERRKQRLRSIFTLKVDGPGVLDASGDEIQNDGIQMTMLEGQTDILLTSTANPGTSTSRQPISRKAHLYSIL